MSMCSQCRMEVPGGARVCPFCRSDRSGDLHQEAVIEAGMLRFAVSALLIGVPACLLWYRSALGSTYPGAFWLIFPVAGVVGYRPVGRHLRPALWLAAAYLLAGGYYVFWS